MFWWSGYLTRVRIIRRTSSLNYVSKLRCNHHVEAKSVEIANSGWLRDLIRAGYAFASFT
ncbi:hypothetical protein C7K25_05895 [Gulosibacter molinativorax]|uniref:Uncharacterized protein n=1 Tax=Gulosibacter molinativorax TaxID=256821 RepID=A0ABT7C6T8_9MICO|nr:hypothetical protein [Gulosibacter molinativorax]